MTLVGECSGYPNTSTTKHTCPIPEHARAFVCVYVRHQVGTIDRDVNGLVQGPAQGCSFTSIVAVTTVRNRRQLIGWGTYTTASTSEQQQLPSVRGGIRVNFRKICTSLSQTSLAVGRQATAPPLTERVGGGGALDNEIRQRFLSTGGEMQHHSSAVVVPV